MTRKLKALGLAFVAVLAFGALSATAASAASFHSEAEHTMISGSQVEKTEDVFTVKAGTVKCTSATYAGTTAAATTETVTVEPTYSGCTAFGFVNAPVKANGCTYTFNAGGSLAINCPAGAAISVEAFNCHITVPGEQEFKTGISYDNAGSGTSRDITTTAKLSGIKYTQTNRNFPNCSGGAGSFSDGTYEGSGTVKGANTTGGAVGIWQS